jgi:serine/threonine protein kinase
VTIDAAPRVDDELRGLVGRTVDAPPSWTGAGSRFRIDRPLGEGGTGVAFFATRIAAEGESPHVVKVFRPSLLLKSPEIAEVSRRKEHAAMRRLNERVPPSPYIVRMTDVGELFVEYKSQELSLPWIASEFVNGGPEGTTLTERIARSVEATGVGFDPERALRCLRCVVEGLSAVHEMGVIHRDIKPDNVLLCGFAETEIAKIADFGVARAQGLDMTFGAQPVGTIGYAAPEQLGLLKADTTTATDTFALGVLLYRVLAADEYFRRIRFAELAIRKDDGPDPRPHLKDAPRLHPEVASGGPFLMALDAAIRKATSVDPARRFPTARAFLEAIEPPLRALARPATARGRRSATRQRLRTIMQQAVERTTWSARHNPGDDRVLRSVAWEPDGRALAVARDELQYWDGRSWFRVATPPQLPPSALQFALRVGAGRFVVGGAGGALVELSEAGWGEVPRLGDGNLVFERAAGVPEELLVIAGSLAGAPVLYVSEHRAWRTPLMLSYVAALNGIARLDEQRFVLIGRATGGGAYLGVYDAATHAVRTFTPPSQRPLLGIATDLEGMAYAVGPGGLALAIRADTDGSATIELEKVTTHRDLSAVTIDPAGIAWAVAQGRVIKRVSVAGAPATWEAVHSFEWLVPAIGVLAAGGAVFACTVDGAVLEGRDEGFVPPGSLPSMSRLTPAR